MGQLTESIIDFLCGDTLSSPPAEALDTAIDGFTDCLAVMVAGAREPVTLNLAKTVEFSNSPNTSRVMLGPQRAAVADCGLIGTAAAHALDFDDYAYSNHVSALLVPPILADAERLGASGQEMLAAYLAGFEVWGTVFKREPDHLHSKGWHPTGIFGPLGVAAALCRLRRLNANECRNALGLAAASGAGVMDNFGYQAKPWQGARATQSGVMATNWSQAGVDAGPSALDGPGGLMAALSPGGHVDREQPANKLGHDWMAAAQSLNIKGHPMVGASQRAVDAAIQLHRDHHPEIEAIERVVARVSEKHAAVMRLHRPGNASEARFSLEFGVAAGLLVGSVGLAQLRDEFVQRKDVQSLLQRVVIETGPDDDPSYPVGARFDTVSILFKDGTLLDSLPVHRFLGHGENPMNEAQLREKFDDCVSGMISPEQAEALFFAARGLAELPGTEGFPVLNLSPL